MKEREEMWQKIEELARLNPQVTVLLELGRFWRKSEADWL